MKSNSKFLLLSVLLTVSALADTGLSQLPTGSRLVLKEDIEIKPRDLWTHLGRVNLISDPQKKIACAFYHAPSEDLRRLKKGSVLTVHHGRTRNVYSSDNAAAWDAYHTRFSGNYPLAYAEYLNLTNEKDTRLTLECVVIELRQTFNTPPRYVYAEGQVELKSVEQFLNIEPKDPIDF